jgi:predicted component of type VI protein secretion system
MADNPELIKLQEAAQEACVSAVRNLVTPFSPEEVAVEDKDAARNAKLLEDLQKALKAEDKTAVKKIQKEIALL